MEEWKEYKLGDICTKIGSGATPKGGKEAYLGGNISLIRSQNVLDFTFSEDGLANINDEQANKLKNVEVKENDVLLNITGDSVARACIVPNTILPARVNQHVTIIRGDNSVILNEFILYALQYKKQYLLSISQGGGTRNALTKKMIEDFMINLPSLPTQQKIANILSSLDDKIEVNRRINEQLEELAGALFKSWFVDFEPFKDGEFVESELGMIPEGWKVGTLGDIAGVVMGSSPAGSSYNTEGNGSIFYQGRTDFGFRFPCVRMYTTEPKRFAESNSVLLSVRAPVGDVNIAFEKCCIGRGLASIKSNCNADSYTYYLMKSLKPILDNYNNEGTVFGCINKDALNNLSIVVPTIDIIKEFEQIVSSFDVEIRRRSEEITQLTTLRDTLLPKLMSGEIDVNLFNV